MAKTDLTKTIERLLRSYDPTETCSKKLRTGQQDEMLTGCSAYFPASDSLWL